MIHDFAVNPDAVVFSLDSDDWMSNPKALAIVATTYTTNQCLYTYGNCNIWLDEAKKIISSHAFDSYANTAYSKNDLTSKKLRSVPFRPLHPRTWKVSLFKKIPKSYYLDSDHHWLRFCEDMAIFFPIMELAPTSGKVIKAVLTTYTVSVKRNDASVSLIETLKDEIYIRKFQHA